MKTVQKNNIITIKKLQQYIEKNNKKLGLTEERTKRMIKAMKSKYISREERNIFYQECLKKADRVKKEKKGKH